MILFPIAFLWVAIFMIWLLRQGTADPDAPRDEHRRWIRRPRGPAGPGRRPSAPRDGRSPSAPAARDQTPHGS
jgi:hypothetical protein